MESNGPVDTLVPLVAFDPSTARAVVEVLRRAGITAMSEPLGDGDDEVRVPEAKRGLALTVLSDNMERIAAAVAQERRKADEPAAVPDPDDPSAGPPLVMERFRRMGFVPILLLVPLLALTLGTPGLPRWLGMAILVALVVALVVGRMTRR